MKRETIINHLALARRHVAEGLAHIAQQRRLIARLEARGHDAAQARRALATMEHMQGLHEADRERLEQALALNDAPFTSRDNICRAESTRAVARSSADELAWYQAGISETADVLQRGKDAINGSRDAMARSGQAQPKVAGNRHRRGAV